MNVQKADYLLGAIHPALGLAIVGYKSGQDSIKSTLVKTLTFGLVGLAINGAMTAQIKHRNLDDMFERGEYIQLAGSVWDNKVEPYWQALGAKYVTPHFK